MGTIIYRAFVGLVFLFLLLPIFFVVVSSFNQGSLLAFPPTSFTTAWYKAIPDAFLEALRISLIVACTTALLSVVLGIGIAMALARGRFRGKQALEVFVLSPLMVPHLVIGVALFQFSLVIWDLTGVGIAGTVVGLALAHTAFALPFVVRAVVAGHALFDPSLEEAALSLGASRAQTFFRITMPALVPGVLSGAIFAFLVSFDDVPVALFMGGGDATTLPVKIFTTIEFSFTPDIMAISAIIVYASIGLMVLLDRTLGLDKFFDGARA